MSVSIPLEFIPPNEGDIETLHIFEATDKLGPFSEIEVVTEIGTFPNYIQRYTTEQATALDNWFSIQWGDNKGGVTQMSAPVRGGSRGLVQEITDRVVQRDPSIDKVIALWETEGAVEWYFNADPYGKTKADIDSHKTYRVINGLTYLALARAYIGMAATHSGVEQAQIGVVSFRTQAGVRAQVDIQQLIDLANKELDLNTSLVMQMQDCYLTMQSWRTWYEDWQVEWQRIPWILGIPHWELPGTEVLP